MAASNKRLLCDIVDGETKWIFEEENVPETPKDGILIKVHYAGICHSDAHMSQKDFFPGFLFPRVFGHEISGVVHDIGDDVLKETPDFKKDDAVVVYPWGNCGDCPQCDNDMPFCSNSVLPGPPEEKVKLFTYGVWRDGGYQNYVIVHQARLVLKVPDKVPLEIACMAPCSAVTAFNACEEAKKSVERAIKIKDKAIVGIIGAGGLGLWAIQFLKVLYPTNTTVVAIDVAEDKLTDAKAHGVDKTFQWGTKDSVETVVGSFLGSIGGFADVFIDFTGIQDAQLRAYALLAVGGTLVQVGLGKSLLPPFPITANILKQITTQGVNTGSIGQLKKVLRLIADDKITPPPVTIVTINDVESTINLMHKNQLRGRNVVKL